MENAYKLTMDSPQDSILSPTSLQLARRRSTVSSMAYSQCSSPDRIVDSATCTTPYSDLDVDVTMDGNTFSRPEHYPEPGCIVPKIEDMGFDFQFDSAPSCTTFPTLEETKSLYVRPSSQDLSSGNVTESGPPTTTSNTSTPRKTGRPRKLTVGSSSSEVGSNATVKKTTRVRSKTGCGTCRRRKKKCDEAKPHCLNCEKNNVVCDGYEPKQAWTSGGRQRSLSAKSGSRPSSMVTARPADLPLLIPGVDGAIDQRFFQNFLTHLGGGLCLPDERGVSPFLDIVVPMAMAHSGVMHSLLFLSGSCLAANESTPLSEWGPRIEYHSSQAVRVLQADLSVSTMVPSLEGHQGRIKDESIAQTLLLCLQTIGSGDTTGSYRFHLNAMKEMLVKQSDDERRPSLGDGTPASDRSVDQMDHTSAFSSSKPTPFRSFILEILQYLDQSSMLTSAQHTVDQRSQELMVVLLDSQFPSAERYQSGNFIGVVDGLFALMERTRRLRDRIRLCRSKKASVEEFKRSSWPSVSASVPLAQSRTASLSTPVSPKQQTFNFTQQTAQPQAQSQQPVSYWTDSSITNEAFAIDTALRTWTPPMPTSDSTDSCVSRYGVALLYRQCAWLYLRRTVRESRPDEEGKQGVEEGLGYLRAAMNDTNRDENSGRASMPMQAVLLLPLFILGCAAFDPMQRKHISDAFDQLQASRGLGNIRLAKRVVEDVWALMDSGCEQESWDWESVLEGKGWDFVVA